MSFGPCMCGDTHCPSCGPAQGNSRCNVCGAWADDGCEDPERCARELPAVLKAQAAADDAYAEGLREDQRLAEEFWNEQVH